MYSAGAGWRKYQSSRSRSTTFSDCTVCKQATVNVDGGHSNCLIASNLDRSDRSFLGGSIYHCKVMVIAKFSWELHILINLSPVLVCTAWVHQ